VETERIIRISWVDFIQIESIQYLNSYAGAPFSPGAGRFLSQSDLAAAFALVRFQVADNVDNLPYRIRDGDAAFLPAGTTIYCVRGYAPTLRLAAWKVDPNGEQLCLYEVDTNPKAERGKDLMDIDGGVTSIHILSAHDGQTELARIDDMEQVQELVAMIFSAPVDQAQHDHEGAQYFLSFDLHDGTAVTRSYWPGAGELSRGILLPRRFTAAIQEVLAPS
jgi:hypothetical protein